MIKHATVICSIDKIGELQEVHKMKGNNIYKIPLTVSFADGRTMYPELRNKNTHLLDLAKVEEGDDVILDLSFEGSEKKGIRYNNINVIGIKKLEDDKI